jgi:hypothetical protein
VRRAVLTLLLSAVAIPPGWPHQLALGVSDPPGDALALRPHAPVDLRDQFLSGGVNTGHGWATWDPGGSFASTSVGESVAAHVIPVLTCWPDTLVRGATRERPG